MQANGYAGATAEEAVRIARRAEEIMRRTVPGDPFADDMVADARGAFPAVTSTAEPRSAIGDIEDDPPTRRRRYPRLGREF